MGLFDRLTGKGATGGASVPDDYELASMIATTIEGIYRELGADHLFRDGIHIVLNKDCRVSAFWGDDPSCQPGFQAAVRLDDLNEFDSLRSLIGPEAFDDLPPETARELAETMLSTVGYMMVDQLATAILRGLRQV